MNTLFRPPAPVPITDRMTPNQQTAWALITSTPGGVYADEIGAKVHPHDDDARCDYCATTGIALCKSKALRGLVIKRKATRRWEPREARYRAQESTSQLAELPDDLFGDAA
jgi:hypothetical protein